MEKRPRDNKARRRERAVYIALVVIAALYGLFDSEGAAALLRAIAEAFAVLFDNP